MGANVHPVGGDRAYQSASLEKSAVVSTRKGKFYDVVVYNKSGSDFYLLVYDAASVPADATAAGFPPLLVPNGQTGFYQYVLGRKFELGLVVLASSTDSVKTLIGSNGACFDVNYQEQ